MKGVIFAGGNSSRLRPFTYLVNKSLLPVYDKPLIYFPITTLVKAGIEDIIISTAFPDHFQKILSDEEIKANISYTIQSEPRGLVDALRGMKEKIKENHVLAILGDSYLPFEIRIPEQQNYCVIYVSDFFDNARISDYGVVQLDRANNVVSFEEKPKEPKGKHIHIGITFFPSDMADLISNEEIKGSWNLTDLANFYHKFGRLSAIVYSRERFNVNTPRDLFLAAQYREREVSNM